MSVAPARARTVWRLRSHLAALLVVAMVLSFALALAGLLAWRMPRIEAESRRAQAHEVGEMRKRMELLLRAYRTRMDMLQVLVDDEPHDDDDALLSSGVGDSSMLRAIYRVSPQDRITAVGLPPALRWRRADVLGHDLSGSRLLRDARAGPGETWSALHPSVLNGEMSVALAVRDAHGGLLVAEMPLVALQGVLQAATGRLPSAIWVVDRAGEVVADSRGGRDVGRLNIWNWPLMQTLRKGGVPVGPYALRGGAFHAAVAYAPTLDWYFIAQVPAGWANPQTRVAALDTLLMLAGGLLIGLLSAPLWAGWLVRPLGRIVDRADRSTRGQDEGLPWPRGSVAEFNRLAGDLEGMTAAVRNRERKAQAIFHAAPVPMAVTDVGNDPCLVDVNEAWCREFRFLRSDVLGRSSRAIGLLPDDDAMAAPRERLEQGGFSGDIRLRRSDGTTVLMQLQLHARVTPPPGRRLVIWAGMDIGPIRRAEDQLRAMNTQLEERVRVRTEALASAHAALSQTVVQLRTAQDELVRAEKMAALGSLVAGVAHELNTPLGNGVLAVGAMADATRRFQSAMQAGVRRADLQQLMQSVEEGADIAGRNLRRAADLVQSFKQVAVDQTSDQRRCFELGEVVHEMVVSLQPSFARRPWRIEVQVPAQGLSLDSYPGALGQVLGNLIQNAVLHGFDGRDHGVVRITAGQGDPGWVWLRVADDGHGIAPAHIDHVFDPFMTTRMGRGGTGLGLHISHNAVANLLGGLLTVQSQLGQGTTFEIRLPAQAPQPPAGAAAPGGQAQAT